MTFKTATGKIPTVALYGRDHAKAIRGIKILARVVSEWWAATEKLRVEGS